MCWLMQVIEIAANSGNNFKKHLQAKTQTDKWRGN